jgi:hypothetical protein
LKSLLEIITLVPLANNIGFDIEFILMVRSFMYIMNNIGHRIDPLGISSFYIPLSQKKV